MSLPALPAQTTSASSDDKVVTLSPFTVDASKDKGYFAQNTLAGSRLNTNISDLASSISVVTKQEMLDTASVDMNDVFRYQVNTEGSATYTPAGLTFRSDGILDVNAGGTRGNALDVFTNATANRVRGLGVPSIAINYYPANPQIPLDAYNTDSVEINRGPNSLIFGLGSPAGIVNQSTAQANLRQDSLNVTARFDDRGSFRSSFAFNKALVEDKLGIYGAAVYDNRAFERKPSYDRTRREYAAITFKPFSKTTIRANIEGYRNDNNRPNTLTPRDFVTQWNLAGQPAYDPLSRTIRLNSGTGAVVGDYVISASSPYAQEVRDFIAARPDYNPALWNSAGTQYNGMNVFGVSALTTAGTFAGASTLAAATPSNNVLFVPGITWTNAGRTTMQIVNGQLVNWYQPLAGQKYLTSWGTATNPAANPATYPADTLIWANPTWADIDNRDHTSSNGWTGINNGIIGYKYPGVSDKSIYNWEKVNATQMNFGRDRNTNYNVELEQQVTDDLFLSAGWFRQDFHSRANYTVSQLNYTTLFVDTNLNNPDGSRNPLFGKPYVEDQDPDSYTTDVLDDHYRAMAAWTPDFTKNNNWTKWLGHHQLLGLWEKDDGLTTTRRQRLQYVDGDMAGQLRYMKNPNNNADGTPTGWNHQSTSLRRTFYLAGPDDPNGTVTQGSGEWQPLTYTGDIKVYDYANSQFSTVNVTTMFDDFDAGTERNQRVVKSLSGAITSYLWNDRLIGTFGVRQDKYKARKTSTSLGALTDADGNVLAPAITNADKWVDGYFQEDLLLNRWGPWDEITGTTRTIGGVFRPFSHWSGLDRKADAGSVFWQFVRDFGVSYNESSNFNPPASAQGDVFGNALPKPSGEGKDWGVQFSLFDNKLFARVTWFKADNKNERTSPGTTLSRLTNNVDETLFRTWARTIALINMGQDPTSPTFGQNLDQATEDQVRSAVEPIYQQAYTYYEDLPYTLYGTRDAKADGYEAEINYNPTRNWTVKFTFAKQDTKYSNVLTQFDDWYAVRNPVWQAAKASSFLLPQYQGLTSWTTQNGRQADISNFWTSYGFVSDTGGTPTVRLDDPNGWYSVADYYAINVTPQILLARDLEGQSAPEQRKYHWSLLSTYTFDEGRFKGFFVGGAERWESQAIIGYYGKASGANGTQLDVSDISRPIYDPSNSYTDLWVGYRRKIMNNKATLTLRLNVVDAFENGHLQTVGVNYDGSPYAFRIVDPRQFIFTTSLDF
ncbi:MAG TPA: TonB-dependent receptor plug domain-containing protein [Opitutus sp.]|nr:TonB-dependent receptor plug domain-containing protein [Opitutus sp.]